MPAARFHADLIETNLGWLVLAGFERRFSESTCHTRSVIRLLIGLDTRKQAEAQWKNEINSGWLSRQNFATDLNKVRFSNWYPACREKLIEYGNGERIDFSAIPCHLEPMTHFQQQVLHATRTVCTGEVRTYGEIARQIGRPRSARAVGGTMARNPIPIIIPCHRILGRNGNLTGFTAPGGLVLKQKLLELERSSVQR